MYSPFGTCIMSTFYPCLALSQKTSDRIYFLRYDNTLIMLLGINAECIFCMLYASIRDDIDMFSGRLSCDC
jgi:hypothetical protein